MGFSDGSMSAAARGSGRSRRCAGEVGTGDEQARHRNQEVARLCLVLQEDGWPMLGRS